MDPDFHRGDGVGPPPPHPSFRRQPESTRQRGRAVDPDFHRGDGVGPLPHPSFRRKPESTRQPGREGRANPKITKITKIKRITVQDNPPPPTPHSQFQIPPLTPAHGQPPRHPKPGRKGRANPKITKITKIKRITVQDNPRPHSTLRTPPPFETIAKFTGRAGWRLTKCHHTRNIKRTRQHPAQATSRPEEGTPPDPTSKVRNDHRKRPP